MTGLERAFTSWAKMASKGLVVSVCYGPRKGAILFSVDVLNTKTEESFPMPIAAETFNQAIDIAETECIIKGWL